MSVYEQPHIIVEEGIERGREVKIPENGARIGRAHENDVVFDDPSLSRFQCRLYFKEDRLWMADLGSANGSLVNGKEVPEAALKVGDEVIIGEMSFRIVRDTFHGSPAPYPGEEKAPAPVPEEKLSLKKEGKPAVEKIAPAEASSSAGSDKDIDLGLGKTASRPGASVKEKSERKSDGKVPTVFWMIAILTVLAAAFAVVYKVSGLGNSSPAMQVEGDTLAIYYEKIEGDPENVFYYEMILEDKVLKVNIDNLTTDQHITEEATVPKDILATLRTDVINAGFSSLQPEYVGLSDSAYNAKEMIITMGNKVTHSKVLNRAEPDEFAAVRKLLETFAEAQLGLAALALPPEELKRLAADAHQLAQDLYSAKNVQPDNLWRSLRSFRDVEIHLRTIEPKPDYYSEALSMQRTCNEEMQSRYDTAKYQADRAMTLRDWPMAAEKLKVIMEQIPDRGDERYDAARRKLLEAERNMER
jgi:hypothetical protein